MYKVELHHFYPEYRNGDREEGTELLDCEVFKTKKAAKEYCKRKSPSNSKEHWQTGYSTSYVTWFTGETWINENSGEKRHEYYQFQVKKVK